MYRFAVLFCVFSVQGGADTTCNDDEHSLLQARVQQQRQAVGTRVDPEILLESTKRLLHESNRESPDVVIGAVDTIKSALSSMTPLLEEEHRMAQEQIDHQLEEIQACLGSESHGTAVLDDLAVQLSAINDCSDAMNALREEQQQACNAWESHANQLVFPSTILPASRSSEEVYDLSLRLREWVADEVSRIDLLHGGCKDATSQVADRDGECAPVIAQYDETFCEHKLSCTFLEACHAHEVDRYNQLVVDSAEGVEARQAQWRTVAQINCILGFITDAVTTNTTIDESSLGSCDTSADVVENLALSTPDIDAAPACPLPTAGDPSCPDVQLPEAWAGGEATAIVSDQLPQWTLILQYGTEPYTPTAEAVGVLDEGASQFAKLSDAAINALPSGGDSNYDYYKMVADRPDAPGQRSLFLLRTATAYDDESPDMGIGHQMAQCIEPGPSHFTQGDARVLQEDLDDVSDCPQWSPQNRESWFESGHQMSRNNCEERWLSGYAPHRFNVPMGMLCYGTSNQQRCFANACHPGMRTNLMLYKFTR